MKCNLTSLIDALKLEFPLETCGDMALQISDLQGLTPDNPPHPAGRALYHRAESAAPLSGRTGVNFEFQNISAMNIGEPQYTDLIVKNENGLSATWLAPVYMDEYGYVEKYTKFDNQMTQQQQLEAREIWSDHVESRYDLPKALTLTAEESELFSKNMADIASYTSESILKMLTGEMDIDQDYGTFVDTIYSMGLQNCIDCYQAALTRYNARSEAA